eukprot:3087846-Prymnesium_polylepis.1
MLIAVACECDAADGASSECCRSVAKRSGQAAPETYALSCAGAHTWAPPSTSAITRARGARAKSKLLPLPTPMQC